MLRVGSEIASAGAQAGERLWHCQVQLRDGDLSRSTAKFRTSEVSKIYIRAGILAAQVKLLWLVVEVGTRSPSLQLLQRRACAIAQCSRPSSCISLCLSQDADCSEAYRMSGRPRHETWIPSAWLP